MAVEEEVVNQGAVEAVEEEVVDAIEVRIWLGMSFELVIFTGFELGNFIKLQKQKFH